MGMDSYRAASMDVVVHSTTTPTLLRPDGLSTSSIHQVVAASTGILTSPPTRRRRLIDDGLAGVWMRATAGGDDDDDAASRTSHPHLISVSTFWSGGSVESKVPIDHGRLCSSN